MEKQTEPMEKLHKEMRPAKERMANLELMRMVSMLLVVVLHFIGKSNQHPVLTRDSMALWEYGAWALESLSIVAVNVYMLLSGYLLAESTFKPKRLLELWLQILFYSAGVGLVAAAFGYVPQEGISIYYLAQLCLPVVTNHYWFMTAYIGMYLFLPILATGVKQLSKKQFQILLCILFSVFCGIKSVVPLKLTTDMQGYDCIWYLCMALLAVYIRLYGMPFFQKKRNCILVYLAASAGIFAGSLLLRYVYLSTGRLGDMVMVCYQYNHILVVLASLGFFHLFLHIRIKPGRISRIICTLAPYTLGVYLWHENIAIRYEWPLWIQQKLPGGAVEGVWWFVALVLGVLFVYCTGIVLDMVRSLLFKGIRGGGRRLRRCRSMQYYIFSLLLFLYPLRHVCIGLDLRDTGYNYANLRYMGLEHMDPMWLFSTYLANAAGHFLTLLPGGHTLLGMNIYTSLVICGLALLGYWFCTHILHMPAWLAFLGEFVAVSLCWAPSAVMYHYLTYALFLAGALLLYLGLVKEKPKLLIAAGAVLGSNVFVRFPNITEAALIVALWGYGIWKRKKAGRVVKETAFCLFGYLGAVGIFVGYIAIRYGISYYTDAIAGLFQMTDGASDYKAASMLESMFAWYTGNIYWVIRILFFMAAGVVTALPFPGRFRKIKAFFAVCFAVAAVIWLYIRGFCSLEFDTYNAMLLPAVLFLLLTLFLCLIQILGRKTSPEEKLLAAIVAMVVLLTPLGSNNGLYPSINNLFLAAPYTFFVMWKFCRYIPQKKHVPVFPVKAVSVAFLCVFLVQSTGFGVKFVFEESKGAKNTDTKIGNSDILKDIYMNAERAEWLQSITAYVKENNLMGSEVILYGDIPGLSFYLDMPSAFNPWSDLRSYSLNSMETDMAELEGEIAEGKACPVVILEKEAAKEKAEEEKMLLIVSYMEKYQYMLTFENDKFALYEAEKREYD